MFTVCIKFLYNTITSGVSLTLRVTLYTLLLQISMNVQGLIIVTAMQCAVILMGAISVLVNKGTVGTVKGAQVCS